jgi:hypothetical protein
MYRVFAVVLLAISFAIAQQPQQQRAATPEEVQVMVNNLLSQSADLTAGMVKVLPNVPGIVKQLAELQAQGAAKDKKIDSLETVIKKAVKK